MNCLKRKNTEKLERNDRVRPTCPLTGLKEITSKGAFFAFLFHFYSFVPITLQIMSGVETSLCHVVLGVYWAWTRVPVHGKGRAGSRDSPWALACPPGSLEGGRRSRNALAQKSSLSVLFLMEGNITKRFGNCSGLFRQYWGWGVDETERVRRLGRSSPEQ